MEFVEKSLGNVLGYKTLWYNELASTNNVAAEQLVNGCPDGTTVVSDFQTKGRGQQNNSWESERGKNLTFSLALYPNFVKAESQFTISKIVSVGMVDFLASLDLDARIKWPNDIYVGDKKIVGILIEHSVTGNSIANSVVGIGLNLNQAVFVSNAPNPTSVTIELGREFDREEALSQLLKCIEQRYLAVQQGDVVTIEHAYLNSLYRLKGYHRYESDSGQFDARIVGIRNTGELVLETKEGKQQHFAFKEVRFLL